MRYNICSFQRKRASIRWTTLGKERETFENDQSRLKIARVAAENKDASTILVRQTILRETQRDTRCVLRVSRARSRLTRLSLTF